MTEKLPRWMIEEWMKEPLDKKISRSKQKIKQFYDKLDGQVHVSTSGGKDSTVLLHLVRTLYPDTVAVNVAVPMYPETMRFLKTVPNLTQVVPKHSYQEVITKHGYPVVSKEVSKNISRYCGSRDKGDEGMMRYRLTGDHPDGRTGLKLGVIPEKWKYLIDAPFKISDKCCDILKKKPLLDYEKKHDSKPYIGILASESDRRMRDYQKNGCNIFTDGKEKSMPLSFWTTKDIWNYIKTYKLPYSPIYDKGETRTGCIGCLFGCQYERQPNRFQRLYHLHPKIYSYYIETLKLGEVMDYMGLQYHPIGRMDDYL